MTSNRTLRVFVVVLRPTDPRRPERLLSLPSDVDQHRVPAFLTDTDALQYVAEHPGVVRDATAHVRCVGSLDLALGGVRR